MYNFIKDQWIMGKYTVEQVQSCVTKGYITQDQANEILAMPQI